MNKRLEGIFLKPISSFLCLLSFDVFSNCYYLEGFPNEFLHEFHQRQRPRLRVLFPYVLKQPTAPYALLKDTDVCKTNSIYVRYA